MKKQCEGCKQHNRNYEKTQIAERQGARCLMMTEGGIHEEMRRRCTRRVSSLVFPFTVFITAIE